MHTRCNKSVNQYVVNIVTLTYGVCIYTCICVCVRVRRRSRNRAPSSFVPSFRIFSRFDRSSPQISLPLERTNVSFDRNITFQPRLEDNSIVFDARLGAQEDYCTRKHNYSWSKLALLHDYVELDCGLDYTGGSESRLIDRGRRKPNP